MSVDRPVLFRRATGRGWERSGRAAPFGDGPAWRSACRYVAGRTAEDALRVCRKLAGRGVASSVGYVGYVGGTGREPSAARRVTEIYLRLAAQLHDLPEGVWLSVDLTRLGLDTDPGACAARLAEIARALPAGRRLQVGAENEARAEATVSCVTKVAGEGLADRLGATAQANLRRTPDDLARLTEAGVAIRLVKGAYTEPEDRALPFGEPVDVAFVRLAHRLRAAGAEFSLATHHGVVREALLEALGPVTVEQVYGMRPEAVEDLTSRGVPVRLYVPFGGNRFRHWMRRLAEPRRA